MLTTALNVRRERIVVLVAWFYTDGDDLVILCHFYYKRLQEK